MIKWFIKLFRGELAPKYLSGKEESSRRLIISHLMDVNSDISKKS